MSTAETPGSRQAAGFDLTQIIPTQSSLSVIEGVQA
jgi:hypothetical protein